MTKIAWFSTDWQQEPVMDEIASKIAGRPRIVPGQKKLSYGGTYMQRMALPAMELQNHGYESVLAWQYRTNPDGTISFLDVFGNWHDDCQTSIWQRWMGENGVDVALRAIANGHTLIQDCDDNFAALPASNIARKTTDPLANPTFNRDHYRNMMGASSAIITSTETIRADLSRLGKPTFIARNCIDIERWSMHDAGVEPLMPGWVGGVSWRANDLKCLRPILPQFLEDYDLPFWHGGDSQDPTVQKAWDQIGINTDITSVYTTPLCHIAEYPKLWDPMNLALVPLERCAFNKGKSWLKGLEASACGIPFIYSSHMPEYDLLGAGVKADNARPKTWRAALDDMLDPDYRREEGVRNRAIAEQHDIREGWRQWHDIFNELGVGVDNSDSDQLD